jgi:hypothetical protein
MEIPMRTGPETQHHVRHQVARVWDAPDHESLRTAVHGLATALEAHLEAEADGQSLLSATAMRAPHQASAVEDTRRREYDLWRRAVHLRHDLEREARPFGESRQMAETLAADVSKMLRSESALIAGTWYEELGVGD